MSAAKEKAALTREVKAAQDNAEVSTDKETKAVNLRLLKYNGQTWEEFLKETLKDEAESETLTVDELLDFDRDNDPESLLGNRWLCKGKSAVLQGPTGVGKSSLIMQWAISLTLGRPLLDAIPTSRPMRVLIIQAENDKGDMAEAFQDITNAIGLTDAEMGEVRQRLAIVNQDEKTGAEFADYLEERIRRNKPDIVFVDPLLAYVGDDILQVKVMSKFMRNQVAPALRRSGAALIWVHHVGKPGKEERSSEQHKYSGLGSSDLQNFCREVITLSHVEFDTYSLDFGKRGRRLGLTNAMGHPVRKFNIEHSPDGIVWKKSQGEMAAANKAGFKKMAQVEIVYKKIVAEGKMTGPQLRAWAPSAKINANNVLQLAKDLAADEGRSPLIIEIKESQSAGGPKSATFIAQKEA
jgi:AAA domain